MTAPKSRARIEDVRAALAFLAAGLSLAAQPAEVQKFVFEAASVKLGDQNSNDSGWNMTTGRIRIRNMTLKHLIMMAYKVKEYQIAGGPKWLDTDRYTIEARLEDSLSKALGNSDRGDDALCSAMQALLAERFQLAAHHETKTTPAYALTVARSGPKLQRAEHPDNSSWNWGRGRAIFKGANMDSFATTLSGILDRPVIDRTGIPGAFDFKLEWAPDDAADSSKPSLFSAIQEQLGLKLEAQRLPVEILVIDRAEKPGEN